jgi:diguanylate cyclase (GGDEF)-like protein
VLRDRLLIETERAARDEQPLSLMAINLDGFKSVNEAFGHLIGDTVLREIAGRLRVQMREQDVLARYGGDQFIALLPNVGQRAALEIAARLLRTLRDGPFLMPDRSSLIVTGSIGIATLPEDVKSADELMYAADLALETAKSSGRDVAFHYRDLRLIGRGDLSQLLS